MKKRSLQKKLAGVVGIITIIAIAMTGTFAWYQATNKVNEFIGTAQREVILHDDFDPLTGQKEIFAENAGDGVMFIRIKFDEYMDLTSDLNGDRDNKWQTHKPQPSAAGVVNYSDCGGINDDCELFHDHFEWKFGAWTEGTESHTGRKWYLPLSSTPGEVDTDLGDYTPTTGEAWLDLTPAQQATVTQTPAFQIYPMSNYMGAGDATRKAYVGWIYDPADGYFYWSQPLYAGEATALLLTKVFTNIDPALITEYYYALNVIIEAVDLRDYDMWMTPGASAKDGSGKTFTEASANAKVLLTNLEAYAKEAADAASTAKKISSVDMVTPPTKVAGYSAGQTIDFAGMVAKITYDDTSEKTLESGFVSPILTEGQTSVVVKCGQYDLTITLSSPVGPAL